MAGASEWADGCWLVSAVCHAVQTRMRFAATNEKIHRAVARIDHDVGQCQRRACRRTPQARRYMSNPAVSSAERTACRSSSHTGTALFVLGGKFCAVAER